MAKVAKAHITRNNPHVPAKPSSQMRAVFDLYLNFLKKIIQRTTESEIIDKIPLSPQAKQ